MTTQGLDLAVIGNGRTAALLDTSARLVWWCFPRFDGDPVFCRLLAGDEEKGFSDVLLDGAVETTSQYVRNTAIVSTEIRAENGGAIRITDFAPRFRNFGRITRPPQLVRIIEPIAGLPRITIRLRPAHNYGEAVPQRSSGSNHMRYLGRRHRVPADDRRSALLYRKGSPLRSDAARAHGVRGGRALSQRIVLDLPRDGATAPATIGRNGYGGCPSAMTGRMR